MIEIGTNGDASIYTLEVSDSNIDRDTEYTDRYFFLGFVRPSSKIPG
jgi:hypothetical protein